MNHQVFISYTSADKKVAGRICDYLEDGGVSCWIAPRNITPSAEYAEQLIEAIERSSLILLVLSDKANNSPQVTREIERAVSKNIPILPFRVQDVQLTKSMEYFISSHHWLDAFDGDVQDFLPHLLDGVTKTINGRTRTALTRGRSKSDEDIFSLDFHCEGASIRVRSCEGGQYGQKTLKHYDDALISLEKTEGYAEAIKEILSEAAKKGLTDPHLLNSLRQKGQLLYDEIMPQRTKELLHHTRCTSLILGIDDYLVRIPWELLFDGEEFLCRRFSMGRVISTRQEITTRQRTINSPLKMLLVADPQGDLPASHREGQELRDMFDEDNKLIKADLACSNIGKEYFADHLLRYDFLHYAGHSVYDRENPSQSGFLLQDGQLTAGEIGSLAGEKPFPLFVFSNGCMSGETEEWLIREGYRGVYGLANAFLKSGVRHYLGTFWDIRDDEGHFFAMSFYKALLSRVSMGDAVRQARLDLIKQFGEESIVWASYMLYGDPSTVYLPEIPPSPAPRAVPGKSKTRSKPAGQRPFLRPIPVGLLLTLLSIAVAAIWFGVQNREDVTPTLVIEERASQVNSAEKQAVIDQQVAELVKRYREGVSFPAANDSWTTANGLPLVFLAVKTTGITAVKKDFILNRVADNLRRTKRYTIVEREILDKLLAELNLSSSKLADPATALQLGRVLSAKLIVSGGIVQDKKDWLVSLRFIETETTAVRTSTSELYAGDDLQAIADQLETDIEKKLRENFPLQGLVVKTTAEGGIMNIGRTSGVRQDMKFTLLDDHELPLATAIVDKVGLDSSHIHLQGQGLSLREKSRLRESTTESAVFQEKYRFE